MKNTLKNIFVLEFCTSIFGAQLKFLLSFVLSLLFKNII